MPLPIHYFIILNLKTKHIKYSPCNSTAFTVPSSHRKSLDNFKLKDLRQIKTDHKKNIKLFAFPMSDENNWAFSLLIVHYECIRDRSHEWKPPKDTYRRTVNATLEQISDLLKLNTFIRFISHFTRVLLSRGDATSCFTSSSVSQPSSSSSSWFSSSVENSSSSKNDPPSPYSCVWTDTSLDSRCGEPSMKSANLSARQSTVIRWQNQIWLTTFFLYIHFWSYWACFFNILKPELY